MQSMKKLLTQKVLPLSLLLVATSGFAEDMAMPSMPETAQTINQAGQASPMGQPEMPGSMGDSQEHMWRDIHKAVMLRTDDMLQQLVENGADVNLEGPNSITPLHLAVQRCSVGVLNYLMKKGARVEAATERQGMTPMHMITYAEDCSDMEKELMVDLLMHAQAMLDAKAKNGETPLYYAVSEDDNELARVFLERGADAGVQLGSRMTLFHMAVNYGVLDFVEMALAMRPELVNLPSPETQETPLMMAMRADQREMVMLLLKSKAMVDMQDKCGETALHYAAILNTKEIMSMLLEHECCIDAQGIYNYTPMHYAAMYNCVEIIRMLAAKGASLEVQDAMGRTPLHIAALNGSLDAVEMLLELGAQRDAHDNAGNTALDLMTISSCRTGQRSGEQRMQHRELMYELSLSTSMATSMPNTMPDGMHDMMEGETTTL